jgi:hypothetical protein
MKKDVESVSCSSTKFIKYGDRRPCGHHLQKCEEFMGIVRPGRPLYKRSLKSLSEPVYDVLFCVHT